LVVARENIEIVRRMLASFHHGDVESALACFSRDVVADVSRRPDGRIGIGRTELAQIIGEWLGTFEEWTEEITDIRDLGQQVIVVATQRGRGKGSGAEVATEYATIYGLRQGEIVSMTLYPDPAEGRRAAGLQD
jgi:ketosteroid isomerase-like protein